MRCADVDCVTVSSIAVVSNQNGGRRKMEIWFQIPKISVEMTVEERGILLTRTENLITKMFLMIHDSVF